MTIDLPHETARQSRLFTCWPSDAELWEDNLEPAQAEFAAFLKAVVAPSATGVTLDLTILASTAQAEASAKRALGHRARVVRAAFGDVWARDTGPVFLRRDGEPVAVRFRFNGWGGKYELPGDDAIGGVIAKLAGAREVAVDLVAEGGALEFDGEGTLITTRQCLLNPNRNPGLGEADVEAVLKQTLGVDKVLWIDEGLVADHTDGHIDNIVRFARPGVVVCQSPWGDDDPQAEVLAAIARQLAGMTDARGRHLQVCRIPSPGRVDLGDGEVVPASHMNWVIGPRHVVVPVYGTSGGEAAVTALRGIFPDHEVVGASARAILTGGGAFHCVTCHQAGE
ncbi:agmatine deiminase family protein [Maricaulis maris]|uniref:Agmatine deiminase n=1 Tax=Maricaulis maris TaxID=74318 RepID=A0A495D5Q0_9PROT|nr:agmatine deiminase family protein [Maricaulis maris]RKQ96152.1 agmatine deiminase [Maricaulis maris]